MQVFADRSIFDDGDTDFSEEDSRIPAVNRCAISFAHTAGGRRELMNRKLRVLLTGSLVTLLFVAGWPSAQAGNTTIAPPPPPPPEGTTIAISAVQPQPVAPGRVDVHAQLMLGGKPLGKPALVHFSVIEGSARLEGVSDRNSSPSGQISFPVWVEKSGKVVVRATCKVSGCTADSTFTATDPQ